MMKIFGAVFASLFLLVGVVSANEVEAPTRTLRITTGKVVATVQLPAALATPDKKLSFQSKSVVSGKDYITLKGDHQAQAVVQFRQGFKVVADQIMMAKAGNNISSFAVSGKVSIQIQDSEKQVMQITADSAVLEPLETE